MMTLNQALASIENTLKESKDNGGLTFALNSAEITVESPTKSAGVLSDVLDTLMSLYINELERTVNYEAFLADEHLPMELVIRRYSDNSATFFLSVFTRKEEIRGPVGFYRVILRLYRESYELSDTQRDIMECINLKFDHKRAVTVRTKLSVNRDKPKYIRVRRAVMDLVDQYDARMAANKRFNW